MDKMIEGKSYTFKINKKTKIDNENFIILEDPFNKKHLIPLRHYKNYNFENIKEINCYVDKINCKGQVFIEPDHPFYKRESFYKFAYLKKETRITKQGKKINFIFVLDKYNRECTILPNNNFQKSDKYNPKFIKCKVERVKKGKLYLQNLDFTNI